MKNSLRILFFLSSVLSHQLLIAQDCPGATFNSQAEVDNYAAANPSCTSINGDLRFMGGDIHDISHFQNVTEISGDLRFQNTEIGSLNNSFPVLTSVGGMLRIANNSLLIAVGTGSFDALTTVNDLVILANPLLVSFNTFDKLTEIVEYELIIRENGLLPQIPSFPALTMIGRNLAIWDNDNLTAFSGFSSLTNVTGIIRVRDNEVLTSFDAFHNVTSAGGVIIRMNPVLQAIPSFGALMEIKDDPYSLTHNIHIARNDAITAVDGFNNLVSVYEDVEIRDNANLKTINGFAKLETCGSDFEVVNNTALKSLLGAQLLEEVGSDFMINDHQNLSTLGMWPNLMIVGNEFEINNNDVLVSFSGFNKLDSTGNDFEIMENEMLQSFSGFANLRWVDDYFEIENNPNLKEISGFNALVYVDDDFEIRNNDALKKISGFNRLRTVDDDYEIENNELLKGIYGFSQLESVPDNDFEVRNNPQLEIIDAFQNLVEVDDEFELEDNPLLTFCCAFTKLFTEGTVGTESIFGNAPGCNSSAEILAVCDATLSDCTPNCRTSLNVGLNANGLAYLRASDLIADPMSCSSGLEFTVMSPWGSTIFGPRVIGMNGVFGFTACPFLRQTLKVRTRSSTGTCWTELTLKQRNGPMIAAEPARTVYCFDPLVNGPLPGETKAAWIPCGDELEAQYVTDWTTALDCDPGVNDTVKIIQREWEAFDKDGQRSAIFDTIYVLQFPEITATSIYCAQKDTTYCGDTTLNIGPYFIFPSLTNGGQCDTAFLVEVSDVDHDQMLEFRATEFATKCNIGVHVDSWKFPGDCEVQYKIIVDIKQDCYGPEQTICMGPPAGADPNFAQQLGPGYWRCEFWLSDIDTIGPDVICKNEELFVGPFSIENWSLLSDANSFISVRNTAAQPATAALIEEVEGFDLSELPHSLIFKSETFDITSECCPEDDDFEEQQLAANFVFSPFFAKSAAVFNAEEDGDFNFTWDFTIGPMVQQDDFIFPQPNIQTIETGVQKAANGFSYPTIASVFFTLNGVPHRIVQGEVLDDINPCIFNISTAASPQAACNHEMLEPILVTKDQAGVLNIPLSQGDELIIFALWDAFGDTKFRVMGQNIVSTSDHECAAHTYIPSIYASDDWSGIKQAKATIDGIGTYSLQYNEETNCWEGHDQVKLPYRDDLYKVRFEVFDNCHNVTLDSCYLIVKDLVKPVAVTDKGVTVSLSDKKVWVDAETFDEGSWDNCGVNFLLVRRSDWYEACVDLCDSIDPVCISEHHDTMWKVSLEHDKHVDEVEAHYAKTLQWLSEDQAPCSDILYNAWQYDLIKHATKNCREHPYEVSSQYVKDQVYECKDALIANKCFKPVQLHPGQGLFTKTFTPALLDIYSQIGGGWSDAVPFSCEDACGPVTVEILVMDYWCNWSTAWTKVWVEDKTPIKIAKDVIDEEVITCKVYKDNNYAYPGEEHPVSIQHIVDQAKAGEQAGYDALDGIFGGYCKAWIDPYGNYVDIEGEEIDCDIPFYDSICDCKDTMIQVRVYDDHLGYLWKDSMVRECFYDGDTINFQKGIVAVNCADNVQCEQEVWCEFDHCGKGYIFRKFKIWQSCAEGAYDGMPDSLRHPVDTIFRHQRIWVGNECELDKYMFDVPYDTEVYSCEIEYGADGNVIGLAGPENTGYATYKFDDDCRIVGIAHEDKVFKIVGGDAACYKILRTWYFADWCTYGGDVAAGTWWLDDDIVSDECIQKIIVFDTVAPSCVITGPVGSGDSVSVAACTYDLSVTVDAMDACGLNIYYWELKDISKDDDHLLFDSGTGELDGGIAGNFDITSMGLYPGDYKLKVQIQDACTNESYCEYLITILPGKKPAPVCITSITARLTPWDSDGDGEIDSAHAVVWASEFDRSSLPACDDDSLEYRIELLDGTDDETAAGDTDYLELGCEEIGSKLARLWVISHPSGSSDYCDVVLIVQSDLSGCGDSQPGVKESEVVVSNIQQQSNSIDQMARNHMGGVQVDVISNKAAINIANGDQTGFKLEQNQPNPFRSVTNIGFILPEAMEATVSVYNVTGQLIRSVKGQFMKGHNQVQCRSADLGVQGLLYYQLRAGSYVETRKMLLIK